MTFAINRHTPAARGLVYTDEAPYFDRDLNFFILSIEIFFNF